MKNVLPFGLISIGFLFGLICGYFGAEHDSNDRLTEVKYKYAEQTSALKEEAVRLGFAEYKQGMFVWRIRP